MCLITLLVSIRDIMEQAVYVVVCPLVTGCNAMLIVFALMSLQAYATDERKAWVLSWPGQV